MSMQIYLSVNGQRQGPFSIETVNCEIAAGTIPIEATFAWWNGCADWQPLAVVPGIQMPASRAGMPPADMTPPRSPPPPVAPMPAGDSTGGVIPYKNMPALLAYYLGIGALIPLLGAAFGIASVTLGIVGLRKRRREPYVKGSIHAWIGIVLGSLSILVHGLLILAPLFAYLARS
jgi:hypothetical protein